MVCRLQFELKVRSMSVLHRPWATLLVRCNFGRVRLRAVPYLAAGIIGGLAPIPGPIRPSSSVGHLTGPQGRGHDGECSRGAKGRPLNLGGRNLSRCHTNLGVTGLYFLFCLSCGTVALPI
jgi:hypothetical protein